MEVRSETDVNALARWLRRDVLRDRVATTLSALAVKVDSAAVQLDSVPAPTPESEQRTQSPNATGSDPVWAWGQYLNDPSGNPQTGVFGTAAAIEIIQIGNSGLSEHCQSASKTLPFASTESVNPTALDQRSSAERKGDTRTTFRVAALVHAWVQMGEGNENSLSDAVNALLELRIPGKGWSDSESGSSALRETRFHPTAVALYALAGASRLDPKVAAEAVAPLHSATAPDPGISLWAVMSMALEDVVVTHPVDVACADALHRARREIREWIKTESRKKIAFSIDAYDFESAETDPGGRGKRYGFMFYMPHCLAALAALRSKTLWKSASVRAYVESVVRAYLDRMQNNPLVRPPGRSRDSTVETLWLARLLRAYLDRTRPSSDTQALFSRLLDPILGWRRWGSIGTVFAYGGATFVAVSGGMYIANSLTDRALSEGLGVVVGMSASVLSSIISAVVIDRQGKR